MKKLIQTIILLGLLPAGAVAQTVVSQGTIAVNNLTVEDAEVRLLASPADNDGYDTLGVAYSESNGYYTVVGELLEGQTDPFMETDACPGIHYPLQLAVSDTINVNCGEDAFTDVGVFIGAYSLDSDNMNWYFMTNISSNVESYSWSIDGSTYNSSTVTHAFAASGTYEVELTLAGPEGQSVTVSISVTAGSDVTPNCEALFFPIHDTLPDNNVYFVNSSLGNNLTYSWDFGDGGTSTEQFPTYVFGDEAVMHNVCLTITGDECNDEFCMEISGTSGSGLIAQGEKPSTQLSKENGFTFIAIPVPGTPTGQNEIENQIPLGVYPNPSTGNVTLEMNLKNSGNGIVKITDITGKNVLEQNVVTVSSLNTISLNIENLTDGIYLIQYLGKQNSKVQKVVLQR